MARSVEAYKDNYYEVLDIAKKKTRNIWIKKYRNLTMWTEQDVAIDKEL